jgi:hypothetical protein
MTTVARRKNLNFPICGNEGQSVLEFLFMLPAVIGLVVVMTRINQAIQVSIVDQQYARAQVTFLTFNHPYYPEILMRYQQLVSKNYNQMMIGVADNITPADGSPYNPSATVQNITRSNRNPASQGSNDPQVEPAQRAMVRVRNTVSLCAAPVIVAPGTPLLAMASLSAQFSQPAQYNLSDSTKFDYCAGLTE